MVISCMCEEITEYEKTDGATASDKENQLHTSGSVGVDGLRLMKQTTTNL